MWHLRLIEFFSWVLYHRIKTQWRCITSSCYLNLSNSRISVLPEVEEFLVVVYGLPLKTFPKNFRGTIPSSIFSTVL
jgi:hypothetical protein